MAKVGAVTQVGETLVKLLTDRRALLAAAGQLGDIPATADIAHVSAARMATGTEPAAGLTVMLYRLDPSDFQWPQRPGREPERPKVLGLDLLYLLTAWSANPLEEQALLSWAMLELHSHPLLDCSLLTGNGIWDADEVVQVIPEALSDDALFRLWHTMQRRYRLSTAYRARVVRLRMDADETFPPVVDKRLGFAKAADPLLVPVS